MPSTYRHQIDIKHHMKFHHILFKNATFLLFSIPILLLFAELAIAANRSQQVINSAPKAEKPSIAEVSPVQVTKIQINPSEARLEIILESAEGRSLQIDSNKFRDRKSVV